MDQGADLSKSPERIQKESKRWMFVQKSYHLADIFPNICFLVLQGGDKREGEAKVGHLEPVWAESILEC